MKYLVALVLLTGCAMGPRVPCVCQRNLQDCLSAYNDSDLATRMSPGDWDLACRKDLKVCESNYGM